MEIRKSGTWAYVGNVLIQLTSIKLSFSNINNKNNQINGENQIIEKLFQLHLLINTS